MTKEVYKTYIELETQIEGFDPNIGLDPILVCELFLLSLKATSGVTSDLIDKVTMTKQEPIWTDPAELSAMVFDSLEESTEALTDEEQELMKRLGTAIQSCAEHGTRVCLRHVEPNN